RWRGFRSRGGGQIRIDDGAIAATVLGFIQAQICLAHQFGDGGAWAAERSSYADGERQDTFALGSETDRLHLAADSLGNLPGFNFIGADEESAELFAADATHHVAATDAASDGCGDQKQRLVADEMAVAVVDRLEMVGIYEEQGSAIALPARTIQRGKEAFTIEHSGHDVATGF